MYVLLIIPHQALLQSSSSMIFLWFASMIKWKLKMACYLLFLWFVHYSVLTVHYSCHDVYYVLLDVSCILFSFFMIYLPIIASATYHISFVEYIYIYCQSHAYLATDVHQGFYVFFMKSWPIQLLREIQFWRSNSLFRSVRIGENTYISKKNSIYIYIPGTQMSLVLIGKDLLLEAKQRTNGFQVYIPHNMM